MHGIHSIFAMWIKNMAASSTRKLVLVISFPQNSVSTSKLITAVCNHGYMQLTYCIIRYVRWFLLKGWGMDRIVVIYWSMVRIVAIIRCLFVADRFPLINSLVQKINMRKRRDSLILGGVISVCIIVLLLLAFR